MDVLFGALSRALPARIPAASQGTMNNLTFGGTDPWSGRPFAYYETVAGGMGARPGAAGISGIHTHMTNSRNTPIEVLEHALPVVVRGYSFRSGSGGDGRRRGGDGLIRSFEFRAPAEVTILSERRTHAPWGASGGGPGRPGENLVHRGSGESRRTERLPGKWHGRVEAGDVLEVRTPGGGGHGSALSSVREREDPR